MINIRNLGPWRIIFNDDEFLRCLINWGKFFCLIPLNSDANKILNVMNNVGFFISAINTILFVHFFSIKVYFADYLIVKKLDRFSVIVVFIITLIYFSYWRMKKNQFQALIEEYYSFTKSSKSEEINVLKQRLKRYKKYFILFVFMVLLAIVESSILAPFRYKERLPFVIWYPFPVDKFTITYYFAYFTQVITIIQCGSQAIVPVIVGFIVSLGSAKLEILAKRLKYIQNQEQLMACINHHRQCIEFVDRINNAFGGIVLQGYILAGLSNILGSLPLIYHRTISAILGCLAVNISCLFGTFLYAAPADDLDGMSEILTYSLYDTNWYKYNISMRKSLIMMMRQSQKPLAISPLLGFFPALTKKVYGMFLTCLASYIMTLRAVVANKEAN